jgi:hypothetical protein
MAYVFDKLLAQGIRSGQVPARTRAARIWFRDQAAGVGRANRKSIISDRDRLRSKVVVGGMYMFFYDPKGKKQLPYYDRFPLVVVTDIYPDGFLGLNLHYLPPALRAKLMDGLYTISSNKKFDETTRMRVSYDMLKSASKFRGYKPCVKRYLSGHLRSRLAYINATEWDIALFLPTEQFAKAGKSEVWADSRKAI